MKYISTRGQSPALTFEQALLTGLAPDGGLYVPETIPQMSADDIRALAGQPYEDVAFAVMRPFIGDAFEDPHLRDLIARAYASFAHPARAPLVQIAPNHHLLELFHGPTLAFKDFAMQLIGQLFQAALERSGQRITIVGATSGDTGSAAIEAFKGLENVDVFIMYPHGRVSEVQRRQMSTPQEANVHALALDGDFDDCQAAVKAMFADHAFRQDVGLAAVNSINWGRVLAQVVYYFTAATALGAPDRRISFTVPTGNFGDIYAGMIAKRMGLPIGRLVIATNQNDILHRTLETGAYTKSGVAPTISPSMDIQVSSNFERALFDAYAGDDAAIRANMGALAQAGSFTIPSPAIDALRATFVSGRASEAETLATIQAEYETSGEILCPHTAVGVKVAGETLGDEPMVTLATAHPAKFPDAVAQATGVDVPLPPHMADLYQRDERITQVPNDLDALKSLIQKARRT